MSRKKYALLYVFAAVFISACSGDKKDVSDPSGVPVTEKTFAVFNPAMSMLPVPNDLQFSGETDGTMAGGDPNNPVLVGFDALDGASVLAPYDIAFTDSLDPNQTLDAASFVVAGESVIPNPNQNVFLLPLQFPSGDSLLQAQVNGASVEIPTFADALSYQRAAATMDIATLTSLAAPTARAEIISLDGGSNNVLRINPLKPLMPETKYLVVVTNITDRAGNPVFPSRSYEFLRDPNSPLDANTADAATLRALRGAITGWERLAAGYFFFKQQVFAAAGVSAETPSAEDIILAITFTTGGTDAVLKAAAAPQSFFDKSLRKAYKQDAIAKLVSGTYNLQGNNENLEGPDAAINTTINVLLTSPMLPGDVPNALYDEALAGGIASGATYGTLATSSASAGFIMQTAAAEAAIQIHNSGSTAAGDKDDFTIAMEAAGTVQAIAGGAMMPLSDVFPVPAPRASKFYRVDNAAEINPGLAAPAKIYQGEITLPYYQQIPSAMDASALKNGSWKASPVVGGVIDASRGNAAGTTPPSSMITYRFPFPIKAGEQVAPVLVTTPDEAVVGPKPADGWPVIIYVHGITTDRSASLPMANGLAIACVDTTTGMPTGASCFATVAIDQPLHGVAPAGSIVPGLTSVDDPDAAIVANVPAADPVQPSANLAERHFNFTADAAANPIPMDYSADIGSSGSLFINLTGFTTVRDNLRQMVLDLLNVNASLATMDVDGDGNPDFDTSRVYFIGHSLGAVDGIPFIAVNNSSEVQASPFSPNQPKVQAAVAHVTGGGITRLLSNSPSFAPRILGGLAAASDALTQGKSGLETYFSVFQGVLDSADAMNFAASLSDANGSTGILLTEVIGDGTADNPPDQTIPNAADSIWGSQYGPLQTTTSSGLMIDQLPAPLAGTEPLIAQFGAVKTAAATSDSDPAVIVTRYTDGSHGTPIVAGNTQADPFTSGAVFLEMLTQTVAFFMRNGDVPGSIVTNPTVVEE